MVNLPWPTVSLCSVHVLLVNFLSVCFMLMIAAFTWSSCDVRSDASFATPWYCGFVALLSRTPFRAVSMWYCISHTCLGFCVSPFGVLSKTLNCSLVWCVLFARLSCCFRLIGMRLCGSVPSVSTHPSHPGVLSICRTRPVWSGRTPFVFPNAGASLAVQVFWLTTVPYGARSFF